MNGLEQIILKIEEENKAAVKKITDDCLKEANEQSDIILENAKSEADKIILSAEKKAVQIEENTKSGCEIFIKKQILASKLEAVNECIDYALSKLNSMDDDKYFKALSALILKYAHKGEGELMLNKKDTLRIPNDFLDSVNSKLKDACVTLSTDCADIESGCIIRYGGIEENCSFDALVAEKRDEIRDLLFKQLNS